MTRSMTGYGSARASGSRVAVEVEARSVNGRSLKISLRTPPLLAPFEPELESLVRGAVKRGSVNVSARVELLHAAETARVREDVVAGVAESLARLREKGLIDGRLSADGAAALPGAVELGNEAPLAPEDLDVARRAAAAALAALDDMRRREAARLLPPLREITARVKSALAAILARTPEIAREQRDRLRARVDALLADAGTSLDDATLAREVALLAERSDVTEETTRLSAHVEEFERLLGEDEEIGRRLDFLCQEMMREANTLGAKCADVDVARAVIELKADVDRLKEQAANLE